MAFTIYRSSDTSAPVLSGTAGSLTALLQACLVDGYGSQIGAGWSTPYSGSNISVFRPGAGVRHYFRIADDASVPTAAAKEAYIRGYGAKNNTADVADFTNTDPFPTHAVLASGGLIRKSSTADSTARDWIIAADARSCHLFIFTADTANVASNVSFGEFYSLNPTDPWRSHCHHRTASNQPAITATVESAYSGAGGQYGAIPRAFNTTAAVQAGIGTLGNTATSGATGSIGSSFYPNPTDGAFYFAQAYVFDGGVNTSAIRGRLRGIWWPLYVTGTVVGGDTFSGSGETAGKTWLSVRVGTGTILIETSDTLETN